MEEDNWTSAVTARFEGSTETVRDARRFVRSALHGSGADWADDALLLASELATNAVIHAGTAYTVTVRVEAGRVRVEVADRSPVSARRCRYSPTSGTGRGLGMVEDTAAAWGVDHPDGAGPGKVVWFELRSPAEATGGGRRDRATTPGIVGGDGPPDLDALVSELGGWEHDGDVRDSVAAWAA